MDAAIAAFAEAVAALRDEPADAVTAPVTRVVDALGTWCPVPIHLIDRAIRQAAPGEVVELLADDPLIEVDLPAWCHHLAASCSSCAGGDSYVGRVGVARGRRAETPPRGRARGRSASG